VLLENLRLEQEPLCAILVGLERILEREQSSVINAAQVLMQTFPPRLANYVQLESIRSGLGKQNVICVNLVTRRRKTVPNASNAHQAQVQADMVHYATLAVLVSFRHKRRRLFAWLVQQGSTTQRLVPQSVPNAVLANLPTKLVQQNAISVRKVFLVICWA
jgi:hypothetical protein